MNHPSRPGTADHTLRLPDGRRLSYAEYGTPAGMPVLFFHGAPGSRRSIFADMAEAAVRRGVRLIAPDRPGYGLSDPSSGNSVYDEVSDALTLSDALGIEQFKLIGFSAGSLHALACAHALPARVEGVAIVGGLAPMHAAGVATGMAATVRSLYDLAGSDPGGLREMMAPLAASPASLLATMTMSVPAADQAVLAARAPEFEADFTEALRGGIEGMARSFVQAAGEWAFPLAEIQASVDLWIGTEDRSSPPAMTRYLASVLAHNQVFELPGKGHCCLYTHWPEILDRLTD